MSADRLSPHKGFQHWHCQVRGENIGIVKHYSRRAAEREAVRLAIKTQKPVYVLAVDSVALPFAFHLNGRGESHVNEVKLVDAGSGAVEYFTRPQEVLHRSHRERKDEDARVAYALDKVFGQQRPL